MTKLLIAGGRVVDPLNHLDAQADVLIEDGKVVRVAPGQDAQGAQVLDAKGKIVMPGVIDMHAHMRTVLGHPHAQRMVALAGVTTVVDMAGPLENILESIPTSGSGISIAIVDAARAGMTLSSSRPDLAEQRSFIEKMSLLSMNTLPEVGVSSAPIIFSSVLLPEPDSPTTATNSPLGTEKVASFKA